MQKLSLISDWWEAAPDQQAAFLAWHDGHYRAHLALNSASHRLYAVEDRAGAFLSWNEVDSSAATGSEVTAIPGWSALGGKVSHERFCLELMRDVGEVPDQPAPWLYIVHTDIPDDIVDEYNAWYDEEHLPRLVAVPGILRARRFAAPGASPKYLTAYDLTDRHAFESPAGLKARKTAWTEKMRSLFFNTRRSMARLMADQHQPQ